MSPLVVYTGPTPHVFIIVLCFALVEDSCTYGPHDDAEDEETNGEDGVVGCHFLGPVMASSEVRDHDSDRHNKRDNSDSQKKYLGPGFGIIGPWREVVSFWK